jgi:hypothetical protein
MRFQVNVYAGLANSRALTGNIERHRKTPRDTGRDGRFRHTLTPVAACHLSGPNLADFLLRLRLRTEGRRVLKS